MKGERSQQGRQNRPSYRARVDGPAARRAALVDRLTPPGWYHPAQGGALALVVASFATRSAPVVTAALLLYLAALNVLPRACRRATGVWFTGEIPDRARRLARALVATAVGGILLGGVAASYESAALALAGAVVAYVLVQVLGRRFDAELRAHLRCDPEVFLTLEQD